MNDQPTDYSAIDSFHVGRRRKPNFTDHEVLNIIDQYDMYKELLHSREASKSVIAQKQAVWKQITDNLNATYPQVERSVEDVRRKWKKLQSEAKREANAYRAAQMAGTTPTASGKQMNLYNRILSICRAPSSASSSSQFAHAAAMAAHAVAMQHQHALQQQQQHLNNGSNNHDTSFNDQSSDKADSPSSDIGGGVSGQLDSPGDESASLLGNDDNSPSPATNVQSTSLSSFLAPHPPANMTTTTNTNGQVSKRTLDKRRKLLKSSGNHLATTTAATTPPPSIGNMKSYGQQQNSLRFESLIKRKRLLELTGQRLAYDKERLLIERKNLDVKLAVNECENERIIIEKRRNELALQKLQCETPSTTGHNSNNNNNNNHHMSDQEDHDDNNSLDDMSDFNE